MKTKNPSKRSFYIHDTHGRLFIHFIEHVSDSPAKHPLTLVFLHEGLGSIAQWRDFPEALSSSTGLPALAYDRLGHGESDALDAPRTVHYLHDEALISLPKVLMQANIDDAILIGHSDGGSIALIHAAIHGKGVRGVITEAAHVFVEDVTITGIRRAVKLYETTDFKDHLSQYHRDKTEPMFRSWADTWLSPEFRNWNIEEYLPRITCPLLVIQGEDDEYGTRAQVHAIINQAAGTVESLIIHDCGHVPHHQSREDVLNEMTRFICSLLHSDKPMD